MSDPIPPASPSPKRGSFQSQIPPASTLRLVQDEDDTDVYAASPYPTKPQQILQPTAGSSSQGGYTRTDFYGHDHDPSGNSFRVSFSSQEPPSASTVSSSVDSYRDTSEGPNTGSLSEFSSIGHDSGSTSQIWFHDAKSSRTSIGQSPVAETLEEEEADEELRSERSETSDRTLPPFPHQTIKTVLPSSPQSTPSPSGTVVHHTPPSGASTPNVVPFTSSPNLVPVDSSSPNVVKTKSSNSSLYSTNTFGTARRYWVDKELEQSHTPVASHVYSDVQGSNSPSESIPSSPPSAILRAFKSDSSISLPPPAAGYYARPRTSSKGSIPSASDIRSSTGSVALRFPKVRAPSTASWVESFSRSFSQRSRFSQYSQQIPDRSGAQNPHLFGSDSSDDSRLSVHGPITPTHPLNFGRVKSSGTSRLSPRRQSASVGDDTDESSDGLGRLRSLSFASGLPAASRSSSLSRLGSFRSINRPGSSTSAVFHILPTWTRVYYQHEVLPFQLSSALSFVEGSRPPTAAAESPELVSPAPVEIARPRTRTRQIVCPDPRDPRAHWLDGMEIKEIEPAPTNMTETDPRAWSPHLKRDKGVPPTFSRWKPPSLDESAEPLFGWRNAQLFSFVLGFIFPLGMYFSSTTIEMGLTNWYYSLVGRFVLPPSGTARVGQPTVVEQPSRS